MADRTHIEWTDATWNIVTGCSVVSPGCTNCYAMKLAGTRLKHHPSRAGLTIDSKAGPVWNGQVRFNAEWLTQPLRWTKPRRIFVAAHGDLFHDGVTDDQLDQIFAVMALCPQHTFQVLTKRPERMRAYLKGLYAPSPQADVRITRAVNDVMMTAHRTWGQCGSTGTAITTLSRGSGAVEPGMLRNRSDGGVERLIGWKPERWFVTSPEFAGRVRDRLLPTGSDFGWGLKMWPLPNVWLGVSAEDQVRADERIPILLDTPAALHWLSAEPLLGPLDLTRVGRNDLGLIGDALHLPGFSGPTRSFGPRLAWVVVGGESGPGARPMHPDWARDLRDQCNAVGVPFLFKQWGDYAAQQPVYWEDDPVAADRFVKANYGPDEQAENWDLSTADNVDFMKDFPDLGVLYRDGYFYDGAEHQPAPGAAAGCWWMERVGKKASGRLLDGRLHDGYPEARS